MNSTGLGLNSDDIGMISRVLAKHLATSSENQISAVIVPENMITELINLENLASALHGLTDPLGQLASFIQSVVNSAAAGINSFVASVRDSIISTVNSVGDAIVWAIADYTARVVVRLIDYMGPKFIELGYAVAGVIRELGRAIADATTSISIAIVTAINATATALSGAIATLGSSLAFAINQMATSLSAAITVLGTSLSAAIMSTSYALSQSILSVATSISAAMAALGASLSQAILSVSTAVAVGVSQLATAISGAVVSISTAISGAVVQLSTAFSVGFTQLTTAISTSITNMAGAISAAIASVGASLATAITNVTSSLAGAITTLSSALSNAMTQLSTSIINALGSGFATIAAAIALLSGDVRRAVSIFNEFLPVFTERMAENLRTISAEIINVGRTTVSAIVDFSRTISVAIRENFSMFIGALQDGMKRITDTILENSSKTIDVLNRNMSKAIDAISSTGERLANAIAAVHRAITDTIIASYEATSRAITTTFNEFMDALRNQFGRLSDKLREKFEQGINSILDSNKKVIDFIEDTSKRVTDTLIGNLEKFIGALVDASARLQDAVNKMSTSAKDIVDAILGLPERTRPLLKEYWHILLREELKGWDIVWDEVPRFFKKASPVSPFESLMALAIAAASEHPFGQLQILPGTLSRVRAAGGHTLSAAMAAAYVTQMPAQEHVAFVSLPSELFRPLLSAFGAVVVPAVQNLYESMSTVITTLADLVMNGFKALFDAIINSLLEVFKGMADTFVNISHGTYKFVAGEANPAVPLLKSFYEVEFMKLMTDTMNYLHKQAFDVLKQIGGTFGIDIARDIQKFVEAPSPEDELTRWTLATGSILLTPILGGIGVRVVSVVLHKIASFIYNLSWPVRINLKPMGIGVDFTFNIAQAVGGTLSHFAASIKDSIDVLTTGMIYGIAIWASQPLARMINFHLRNVLPIEMPSLPQAIEITRRHMPFMYEQDKEKFEWTLRLMKYYMSLQGYSDKVLSAIFKSDRELFVPVVDRFGVTRRIPISMMFELPSASDVARMVIRDILQDPEAIKKMFATRGMNEDIATLYYLLHFRYPPPERLWTFYTRGISGLLWAQITPAEARELEREAKIVKGFMPASPMELNFKSDELDSMLKTYMKWHDYARFAYAPKWPSDNLIVIDTLADIPTKIDQRWMVRFGLYQLMSEKGITLESDVSAFVTKLVEPTARSKIRLDLTNFCRTLQATGLHPYYVPVTAVAEVINAITDERTLMRTGVINLYKEGFFDTRSVVRMLTGVLTVSFDVAYFDQATGSWKTGVINVPLRYLEMEARLIALRAIMDRALDILKDIQKDVLTGYSEFIITDYDEFKKRFSEVIAKVNAVYASDFRAVAGQDPPPELMIRFIDEYYKPLVESYDIWREIWTIRRVRVMTQRWLGWLMYRVATGVVEPRELEDLVKFMAKETRMPEREKEYLMKVMEFMAQLSLREYIPTPMQLATLAEHINIPSLMIDKALKKRGVPEEWRELWKAYISVRPLSDDVRALVTAYLRLVRAARWSRMIPRELDDSVKNYARMIGFTDQEFAILNLRVQIEEMIAEMREYIPTPMQLATLVEYVPEAREFFDDVVRLRNIPDRWKNIWAKFIDARALADDLRKLVSRAEQLYVRFMVRREDFTRIIDGALSQLGYTQQEKELLVRITELERWRNAWTELIGSVERLVSLSEYSPRAAEYALGKVREMIDALPLPESERNNLKAMWEEYIKNRPVKAEARAYITQLSNAYAEGLLSRADLVNELNAMKQWGFSDNEIAFYLARAELMRARKLRIPIM